MANDIGGSAGSSLAGAIDRISFFQVFAVWFAVTLAFGLVFHVINSTGAGGNYLAGPEGNRITGLASAVYYSFATATATGYGDISPRGAGLRGLAIAEVIFGLIMLAIVTSKLVSVKQEKLLDQIYHLSFSEKISRLLSGLSVFRADAEHVEDQLKANPLDRRALHGLKVSVTSLKHHLNDLKFELVTQGSDKAEVHVEQLVSQLALVFVKVESLVELMNDKDVTFKNIALLQELYLTANYGEHIVALLRKRYPLYAVRCDEVLATLRRLKASLMGFKVIDAERKLELPISPLPQ